MTMRETIRYVLRGGAVAGVALLAACATQATSPETQPSVAAASTACTDSSYARLQSLHPDSLSERQWQRLQTLDRQCTGARVQARHDSHGATDPWHGGHMMGAGIIGSVIMLAMMIAMW